MEEQQIKKIIYGDKGRVVIQLESGAELALYRKEIRSLPLEEGELLLREGEWIPEELYRKILTSVIGIRAKKRALFLLEQMDRTRQQLREKLERSGYPAECVEEAVAYAERYHYIDDFRYARHYICYHQQKKSRQKLKYDLMQKGVSKDLAEQALLEVFDSDERQKIRQLLEKRHYNADRADEREQRRMYQFLQRRGFRHEDILNVMQKC